jgi:DNA-cytosine methyltransferase
MNVLSLFDGMSCGQQALERAGIPVTNYYASEIDKYAIAVTMANYPNTIQLGSVVDIDCSKLPQIDLLCGGSPCQSFSFAGKRKGMSTKSEIEILTLEQYLELKSKGFEFEGQSYLFWEYMRILKEVKPKYFLLENVMMGEKWQRILTQAIGINPIEINSALVSAQNRRRLYWTNIGAAPSGFFDDLVCRIPQPNDKGILLKDVLEREVDEKYYLTEKMIAAFNKHADRHKEKKNGFGWKPTDGSKKAATLTLNNGSRNTDNFIKIDKKGNVKSNQEKASCFTARGNSGGNHSDMDLIVHNTMPRSSKTGKGGTGHLSRNDGKTYCLDTGMTNAVEIKCVAQRGLNPENPKSRTPGLPTEQQFEQREDGKTNCLTTVQKDNYVQIQNIQTKIRRLTPLECKRLQTVSDSYKMDMVSETQQYRMLGNGWTVSVVCYIFSYFPKEYYIEYLRSYPE